MAEEVLAGEDPWALGTVPLEELSAGAGIVIPPPSSSGGKLTSCQSTHNHAVIGKILPTLSLDSSFVNILEVWNDGVESTFDEIGRVLIDKGGAEYMVAFDTEFAIPDGTVRSKGEPPTADGHYEQLCAYVNRGNLVQVGIGFADERYNLVGGKIFQFNIRFDPALREPDHKGVEVMRKAGLKLEEHAKRGIPAERFTKLLAASGVLGNGKLAWITFMGYIDFGYLIRLLRGKDLPASREHFLNEFRAFFPRSYDCKVFFKYGECIEEPVPGGLSGVASELGVKREVEGHHQAASDALLALKCHRKLMRMKPDFGAKICTMLYGVQPFLETP